MVMVYGKVIHGRIIMIYVKNGRRYGVVRPLTKKNPVTPVQQVVEEVDCPFIQMVNDNHKRHVVEKSARLKAIAKHNRKMAIMRALRLV